MGRLKGKARAKANRKKRLQSKSNFFERRKKLLSLIRKWDDPMLKQICNKVDPGEDVSDIIDTLKTVLAATQNGLGLASPQVGHTKRIFAIRPKGETGKISIFINSEIIQESKERVSHTEGCLSYPDFYINIERPVEVMLQYEDENRKSRKEVFRDMEACIIYHEHDHTFGVCLVADSYYRQGIGEEEVKEDESVSADVPQQS